MASEIIELLKKDKKAREELSEFIASEIALNPKFRSVLVKTVAAELATKKDIKELKEEIAQNRAEIKETEERLRSEIKETEERLRSYIDVRISDLDKRLEAQQRMMQIGFTVLGLLVVLASFLK